MFTLAAITAAITAFYSVRMLSLTFLGKKSEHVHELEHEGHHVHEAPKVMWVPYSILAVATLFFGISGITLLPSGGFGGWLEHTFESYLSKLPGMEHSSVPLVAEEAFPQELAVMITIGTSLTVLAVGAFFAYKLYVRRAVDPVKLVEAKPALKSLWNFLFRRWYINAFFYKVFVYPTIAFSNWALKYIEQKGIDRFNYVLADAAKGLSNRFRRTHTGVLNYNIIGMIAGFILLLILVYMVLV